MRGVDTYQGRGLIADPIHQYILYTRPDGVPGETTEQDLIDSPWMQRLRRVPQLQSARWVFPAAEHSRFQHSLGAMHLAGRFAQQLHPSLKAEFPDAPSAALIEELLRMSGLLHDIGHGPFGHFFDDNFLVDFDLTHEKLGQRIITEQLGDLIRGQRRSPSGPFEPGESIDPEWICYLMGKSYTKPESAHPRWLAHLKPLLSGIYTADNMDYVLRDSYMCGVAVGPIDIERIIYYSFFSDKGLTLDRGGIQAFIMFLNARFYMYTNVYYDRTTRGIDLHLKEIFRDTIRLIFPHDLRKDIHPYLQLTEWTLLEEVARWQDADDPERKALGQEWRHILDRRLKWRMSHEVVLDIFEPRTLLHPGMWGTLGYALPAAIGAQIGRPDRVAVALSGDGGFLYSSQELSTAIHEGLNIVAIVFNDNAFGALRTYQDKLYRGRRIGVELSNPDFAKLGEAYGARGVKLRSPGELGAAVSDAVERGGVTVIECPIDFDAPPPWMP